MTNLPRQTSQQLVSPSSTSDEWVSTSHARRKRCRGRLPWNHSPKLTIYWRVKTDYDGLLRRSTVTSATERWREDERTVPGCRVNSVDRRNPKKARQQAPQNIRSSKLDKFRPENKLRSMCGVIGRRQSSEEPLHRLIPLTTRCRRRQSFKGSA